MPKNLSLIIFYILLLHFISCSNTASKNVFINDNGSLLLMQSDTIMLFQQRSFTSIMFEKEINNSYCCLKSSELGCYDVNRNNYQACFDVMYLGSNNNLEFLSSDSCILNFCNKDCTFSKIENKNFGVKWDSIRIHFKDKNVSKVYNKSEVGRFKIKNHPFSLENELYLLSNTSFDIYYSASTRENAVTIEVFDKQQIIKISEGNIFPLVFQTLYSLVATDH